MKRVELDLKVETELAALSGRIKELPRRSSGQLMSVPIELQNQILAIGKCLPDVPYSYLAKRLGVTGTTIRSWELIREAQAKKPGPKRKKEFRAVEVRRENVMPTGPIRNFVLELPGGARVTGLEFSELRTLMLGESGSR